MRTPLVGSRGLLGVLSVHERFGSSQFSLHDLRQLESLGAELASALERGRLAARARARRDHRPADGTPQPHRRPDAARGLAARHHLSGVIVATVAVESFREVNDTLGHQVGDELLVEVTRRLRVSFPRALLGRIGGGRFAICMPRGEFSGDAALFGLGVRAQVEGGAQLGPVGTHIRLAVGCVEAPEHGDDAATLIRRAETAMYGARHSGGGPVVWEPVYEVEGQRRLAVVMALREAVAVGAIGVAYQPKVHVRSDAGRRGRSAGPLDPPGPRRHLPGRVRPAGRGGRPDGPAHQPGPAAGPHHLQGLAASRRSRRRLPSTSAPAPCSMPPSPTTSPPCSSRPTYRPTC